MRKLKLWVLKGLIQKTIRDRADVQTQVCLMSKFISSPSPDILWYLTLFDKGKAHVCGSREPAEEPTAPLQRPGEQSTGRYCQSSCLYMDGLHRECPFLGWARQWPNEGGNHFSTPGTLSSSVTFYPINIYWEFPTCRAWMLRGCGHTGERHICGIKQLWV